MIKTYTALTGVCVKLDCGQVINMMRSDTLTIDTSGEFQLSQKDIAHLSDLVQSGKLADPNPLEPFNYVNSAFKPFHF